MTRYITCRLQGQLGNMFFEMFKCFRHCYINKINFNVIAFNMDENAYIKKYIEDLRYLRIYEFFMKSDIYHMLYCNCKECKKGQTCDCDNVMFTDFQFAIPNSLHEFKMFAKLFISKTIINRIYEVVPNIGEYITVHIRRGDFQTYKNGKYLVSADTVNKIVDETRITYQGRKILFLSDDIDWVRQNVSFMQEDAVAPNILSDYKQALLMGMSYKVIRTNNYSSYTRLGEIFNQCIQYV